MLFLYHLWLSNIYAKISKNGVDTANAIVCTCGRDKFSAISAIFAPLMAENWRGVVMQRLIGRVNEQKRLLCEAEK